MSYAIRLGADAVRRVDGFSPPLRVVVAKALRQLAASPTRYSVRGYLGRRGQSAEVRVDHDGAGLWVTVAFLYGQDEQTLFIEDVRVEFGE